MLNKSLVASLFLMFLFLSCSTIEKQPESLVKETSEPAYINMDALEKQWSLPSTKEIPRDITPFMKKVELDIAKSKTAYYNACSSGEFDVCVILGDFEARNGNTIRAKNFIKKPVMVAI